ncbi:MAG: hypothetical protein RBG13Loki_0720 [Promethearchaeota archaeon CR_4]|nr:MAG: hypothetical protein RBG13Loki_0720 [Candidatus Lokiarchaeota archaeon CR_4]
MYYYRADLWNQFGVPAANSRLIGAQFHHFTDRFDLSGGDSLLPSDAPLRRSYHPRVRILTNTEFPKIPGKGGLKRARNCPLQDFTIATVLVGIDVKIR